MKNNCIAIIPARGGSKRIPRKNIKDFLGKPIISYSIYAALESGLFQNVIVSTDDEEIAEIAKKTGAQVPFFRSKENSDDIASTVDVLIEVIDKLTKQGQPIDYLCCIYPTAPFIKPDLLQRAYNLLVQEELDSVFPVVRYSYPVQRSLKVYNNLIEMVQPEYLTSRSQDLEPRYHDAGQFYFTKVQPLKEKKKIFTNNSGYILLTEMQVQDIDNEIDWKLAEMKYTLLNEA